MADADDPVGYVRVVVSDDKDDFSEKVSDAIDFVMACGVWSHRHADPVIQYQAIGWPGAGDITYTALITALCDPANVPEEQ